MHLPCTGQMNQTLPAMALLTLGGWVSATCLLSGCEPVQSPTPPPNIVLFLVDDLGWQDTSVPFWSETTPFNELYRTPNMQRLADDGMKFTQAYINAICSPTRVSLLTGMNSARHRVTNWTLRPDRVPDPPDDVLDIPVWNMNSIQPSDTIAYSVQAHTLPELLQERGYHTIHTGKWHIGPMGTPGSDPRTLGFDINIAGHAAGGPGSYQGVRNFGNSEPGTHTLPWGVPGLEAYHGQDVHLSEALTIETLNALDEIRGTERPFFLHFSHYAVHSPIEPDNRFITNYEHLDLHPIEARYASMVEGMDHSLGKLLDYLDEHGLTANTVVLFYSDDGALSARARGGERHTHNAPLNSGKGSVYEGGIRVPMIVRWPGHVPAGTTDPHYLIVEDFFPSILEMAGTQAQNVRQQIDGISFVDRLLGRGQPDPDRQLYWHFPNTRAAGGPGVGTTSAIRQGDYKLVYWYKTGTFELFNIRQDIGESHNLAENYPDKVRRLATDLSTYLRSVDAQRPTFKTTGHPAPWPDEVH